MEIKPKGTRSEVLKRGIVLKIRGSFYPYFRYYYHGGYYYTTNYPDGGANPRQRQMEIPTSYGETDVGSGWRTNVLEYLSKEEFNDKYGKETGITIPED